jgi:hypothetical protein
MPPLGHLLLFLIALTAKFKPFKNEDAAGGATSVAAADVGVGDAVLQGGLQDGRGGIHFDHFIFIVINDARHKFLTKSISRMKEAGQTGEACKCVSRSGQLGDQNTPCIVRT